jgi:clostripain
MKNWKTILVFIVIAIVTIGPIANYAEKTRPPIKEGQPVPSANKAWTIMYFGNMDNDLEAYMMADIAEMKSGFIDNSNMNLIVLADRIKGYSNDKKILGANFTDTRLFTIQSGRATRIGGMDADGNCSIDITTTSTYEANMGDAKTLKQFIAYCKLNYPADRYWLIIGDHGVSMNSVSRDDTSNDSIYIAEMSDVLTASENVDLLSFDACYMSNIEVGYQFRPNNQNRFSAPYLVGSPSVEWSDGWNYTAIFKRLNPALAQTVNTNETDTTTGGYEKYYDPAFISIQELGALLVEEQRDYTTTSYYKDNALTLLDLSKMELVKQTVDNVFVALSGLNNGKAVFDRARDGNDPNTSADDVIYYSGSYNYDLYDLMQHIQDQNAIGASLTTAAMSAIDCAVVYSFGQIDLENWGFQPGKSGVSMFVYYKTDESSWAANKWYNAIDTQAAFGIAYGKLLWCIDTMVPGVPCSMSGVVENYFEALDKWYDSINQVDDNGYTW